MPAFSRGKISDLLHAIDAVRKDHNPPTGRITVHAAVSRFAVLYEKIRTAIDYKDDHLLRKAAIYRILRRQLALYDLHHFLRLKDENPEVIALDLIRELIAARYLPNGQLPETVIPEAARVIEKYMVLRRANAGSEAHYKWLLGIVAAELEEVLIDHAEEKAFVNFLFEQLGERVTVKGTPVDETERRLQVYIASFRSLTKADDEMLGWKLARAFVPSWLRPEEWKHEPHDLSHQMLGVEQRVRAQLKHPLAQKVFQAVKPWSIALGMMRTALAEEPTQASALLQEEGLLKSAIARIAERRNREARAKLRRGTVRAIIYLFVTKMLVALAVEAPAEILLYGTFHTTSLAINILFPPVLMLLVGSLIRLPGKDNMSRIQKAADELLSVEGPPPVEIRIAPERSAIGTLLFSLAYALTFLFSFGLIVVGLSIANFTWISTSIFLFFLCIVSFFAFRLRIAAREYVVVSKSEKFTNVFIDFFSLPILRAGQWLSTSISRINIFVFFFDFIIEAPFKIFLNVLEEWLAYLKEKKEELQ
jgi:hypothetical protein